jgi:septal ring factor EnvC (AmiA/AmiB activator)
MRLLNPKFFLFLSISLLAVFLFAQQSPNQRKELEQKRKELVAKIQDTKKVLEETRTKQDKTLKQLKAISRQIKTRENIINNVQEQIALISEQISLKQDTVTKLKQDLAVLKEDYAQNILAAYKTRNVYDKMMFIFSAKSFNQALKRIQYLNQYSDYRKNQAQLILDKQNELIAQLNEMLAIKREKMSLINMKEEEKDALEIDKREESDVLTSLQKKEKELRKQLAENEKAAKKLTRAIEEMIAREIEEARRKEEEARKREAAKNTVKKEPAKTAEPSKDMYLTPEALKLSNDFEGNKNNLPWPVEKGYITQTFGTHPHPTLKGVVVNSNGVDIATQKGASVRAVFKGTVKSVFIVPGFQSIVLVGHGKYYTAYAHLSNVSVKVGQEVDSKQIIGTVYTDEEEESTEVHFEIYNVKSKLDPELWLKN